ncbi:MAG: hypothetical protein LQ343_003780 [Gyalolechia ehrenbergii]|nr:MAG: hypothetical protein LQ343_003780 [Gyalolechia ehrenbergii]
MASVEGTHSPAPSQNHQPAEHEADNHPPPQCADGSSLPSLPTVSNLPSLSPPHSRKRDLEDEAIGNSSDTPLFSSDDLPASSENYLEHRNKRQRKRTWWDHFKLEYQPVFRQRSKREFKRNLDSGVWMGSDTDVEDDLHASVMDDDTQTTESLRDMAFQNVTDPGNFTGPVFPYWEDQPTATKGFWHIQKAAAEHVTKCIDNGEDVIDFNDFGLTKLQESTLEPLQHLVARPRISPQAESTWEGYDSFTPTLQIYLANNQLTRLPGQLFRLEALTVLSLRGNNITNLPPAISNLVCLRELNVSNNRLRWLPYEIWELLQKKLRFFGFHPNPFVRAMPRSMTPRSLKSSLCNTDPALFQVDGSLARDSPPSPTSTLSHWPDPTKPKTRSPGTTDHTNKTPSLFETSLRACYKSPQLSQLPFLTPIDAPKSIVPALKHTWRVKQEGGQRCTMCNAQYIIPRTEWFEWWQLTVKKEGALRFSKAQDSDSPSHEKYTEICVPVGSPVPLLRRGCSWSCVPRTDVSDRSENGTGWCPAKGAETDYY